MEHEEWQTVKCIRGIEEIAPLYYTLKDKVHFLGGFVRWMASPNVTKEDFPGDIDIYPILSSPHLQPTEVGPQLFTKAEEAEDDISVILHKLSFEPTHETPSATTYTSDKFKFKVQCIKPFSDHVQGDLQQILMGFDFTVVRAGLVDIDQALVDPDFMVDEFNKQIHIRNLHCPITAVKRIGKYIKKGYYISAREVMKVFDFWDERPREYHNDLREALEQLSKIKSKQQWHSIDEDRREEIWGLLYID